MRFGYFNFRFFSMQCDCVVCTILLIDEMPVLDVCGLLLLMYSLM